MDKIHPLYKIIAVLCVGSVAKALFAEPRPITNVTQQVARTAAERAVDTIVERKGT